VEQAASALHSATGHVTQPASLAVPGKLGVRDTHSIRLPQSRHNASMLLLLLFPLHMRASSQLGCLQDMQCLLAHADCAPIIILLIGCYNRRTPELIW
jgi:hypothetical protein